MLGITSARATANPLQSVLTHQVACSVIFGMVLSMPLLPCLDRWGGRADATLPPALRSGAGAAGAVLQLLLVLALIIVSAAWLAGGTYNPFIYFRF